MVLSKKESSLREIEFSVKGKKHKLKARICKSIFCKGFGLMFKKKSPPLFFPFKSFRRIDILSIFCKPFKAIWLDEKMKAIQVVDVKSWKLHIPGRGRYLLEIPLTTKK